MVASVLRHFIAVALMLCACDSFANRYMISDLGESEYPVGINRVGVIASDFVSGSLRGQIYRGGKWHNLVPHSRPYGINRSGDSVGEDYVHQTAMLWPHSSDPVTIPLPGSARLGMAFAVNNAGTIVGQYVGTNGSYDCFMWSRERGSVDLDPTANTCSAFGVNGVGQVTGSFEATDSDPPHAFLWDQGKMLDLGVLANTLMSFGSAVNDSAQVVGVSWDDTDHLRGFLWNGSLVDLDAGHRFNSTSPLSINNNGDIVGWAQKGGENSEKIAVRFAHAQVIRVDSEVTNGDGWKLEEATAINDRGMIVGYGTFNGVTHGFMLTPQ